MEKINICFHIDNISNCGGTEKVTTQISSLLLENYDKYNITILSSYFDTKKGPFFKENQNIKYDRLFDSEVNFKKNYFKAIKKLKKYIIDNNIDVLIGVDTIISLFDIPAIRKTKCKYISWEHFNYKYNLGVKLRDIGRRYSAKKADVIVVLTNKDKKYFSENLKIKNKLIRIYNPFIKKNNENKYNERSNIILSSGRLTYQKGFDILLEIAKELKEKTKDFKWIILGEGEDRELLENRIKEYNLENYVELKGNVQNVEEFYRKSKMFVLTSRFEGLGIVLIEAKSYKLPIVSFNCDCGPSEIIQNNVNGYLIEKFNIEEMTNRIYTLLADNEKCIEFSNKSDLDMDKFEPKKIVNEWDILINEVIQI